ncbi:hypothetical protein CERSUDRAFT_106804 [Gelatoporia subvermispora B]|uniref:Nuclear pore complex protein NUP96 C-terminal domain-containing protein n=1 Tax=Ceriporiopsis subvermispora (strain B) TaxID=914234 RepID=M2PHD6_CERS8|nr:hypothetical protein CERSUDRAFT_106804 [Gelatoporia subvermispora B]
MTRFRAYSTDSEDEQDDVSIASEPSVDNRRVHYDVSASDSSMVEDELEVSAASRKRSPSRLSSPDEEEEDVPNARPTVQFAASSKSPPPAHSAGNPSIIPRARELGIDPQKVHVMQAAFFRVPEEEAAIKAATQPASRKTFSLSSASHRKHSRDSEGEGIRGESRQRASFAQDIEPTPFRPSRKYARVESSDSAVTGNEAAYVDAGLALGRSFRVGWGPGGTLVHLGQLCGPQTKLTTSANSSVIKKTVVPLVSGSMDEVSETAGKLLSHHLKCTRIEPDADDVPCAIPSSDLTFSTFLPYFPPSDHTFEADLFRLGRALFDGIPLRLPVSTSVDIQNHVAQLRRKAALSKWLKNAVAASVDAQLRDDPSTDWAGVVFTHLTGYQIEKACEAAMDGGNFKIASLMSQIPGDAEFREDVKAQLRIWHDERVDLHIGDNIRKIYSLLSGNVHIQSGSKGSGLEQCRDVNVAGGLDWKRAFGLHLWYGEPMDAPVIDAFHSYEKVWASPSTSSSISAPSPLRSASEHSVVWKAPAGMISDGLYSLIRLFVDPACSLSQVLTPWSFSASPVDYSLSWHLYIILSRCLRIRDFADRGMPPHPDDNMDAGESQVEGHSPSADLLANSYAMQLEQAGMIQEAAFVLLHIEGSAGRRKAIKELLTRSAASLDDWTVRGLVGSLKIPMAWLNEAKAVHALYSGDVFTAYELYLAAGLYNAAHDLAVLELAPDAVIRQDLALLKEIFIRFNGHQVDGWHLRGKLFLDYVHAMTRLPELRDHFAETNAVPDAAEAAELEQLARSVPQLISILPDVLLDRCDPRHNAALAEMTANLAHRLDQVKPLAIQPSQIRAVVMNESTRLRNIQTSAYEKFLRSIAVA